MTSFCAELYAATINRRDREPVVKKLLAAWDALHRGADGAGFFSEEPQHRFSEGDKAFYVAMRLDGFSHQDAEGVLEHATRAL